VCRALRVLCAAPDPERLAELKRAAVSVSWELVGGATTVEQLRDQAERLQPDIVVIDARMGPGAVAAARQPERRARVVAVDGSLEGADAHAALSGVKEAILGVPPVGGPVRSAEGAAPAG
jgi:DNA-binding NarL/FixJ family response regulator